MGWLNNAWVVGTATGVVSGLVVYWLLSLFLSKKRDREHEQQLRTANREVIYSIRAGIPENTLPSREVIDALIQSTARRYDLEASELYQVKDLIEELIKEVMDSSFLSSAKKVEYCNALVTLGHPLPAVLSERLSDVTIGGTISRIEAAKGEESSKRSKEMSAFSSLAAVLTALASGVAAAAAFRPSMEAKLHAIGLSVGISIASAISLSAVVAIALETLSHRRRVMALLKKRRLDEPGED